MNLLATARAKEGGNWAILFLGSGCFLGYIPVAPGTWGSLLGIPFHWVCLGHSVMAEVAALGVFSLVAIWIADRSGPLLGKTDAPQIVIDEWLGMAIALVGVPISLPAVLAVFCLFRLFDIWKPFPIGYVDRRVSGGLGVVLDDVLAGILANGVWRFGGYLVAHVR